MDKDQLYQLNQCLQYRCRCAVDVLRCQNYYTGMQYLKSIRADLEQFVNCAIQDLDILGENMQLSLVQTLQAVMQAQENEDYVLLADLIEMQLLIDLDMIQNNLRDQLAVFDDESEIWAKNIAWINKNTNLADTAVRIREVCKHQSDALGREIWTEQTNTGAKTLAAKDVKGVYYFHSNIDP